MLKTVWISEQTNRETRGCVMLLGGFDGLHAGHKKLVERASCFQLAIGAMTIVGGKTGENLFTPQERMEMFRVAGVDFVFELPFLEIKYFSHEAFAKLLEERFAPKAFVCGDDFRFGSKAAGTPKMLEENTQVPVEVVELLQKNGEKISSSAVKRHLTQGEVTLVNELLSERFFLMGEVIKDRGVGKTLGFPTANIVYPKDKFPLKKGVYETRVSIDGREYKGITNYGARPTFDNDRVLTETYLDGFDGDLYGRTLKLEFVRFLREVQKFEGADDLKRQLEKDIRAVREND